MQPIKIAVIGDINVGKTSMLMTYSTNYFPEEDILPQTLDNIGTIINDDNIEHAVTLWDTRGQDDDKLSRHLLYPNTDCLVLCFAIPDRKSFENITSKWMLEIETNLPGTPIVLVGMKLDQRSFSEHSITTKEGDKLSRFIGAHDYVECSAKKKINLTEVFEKAVRAVR